MPIGMFQSRILSPHLPRRYGLLQVADVTMHGSDEANRWIGGANVAEFGVAVEDVELIDCDFEVEEWETATAPDVEQRVVFSSMLTGSCPITSGDEVLKAMQANLAEEHMARLPLLLDTELLTAAISGVTGQGLATLGTRSNPSGSITGTAIVDRAEGLSSYESIILIPLDLFATASEGAFADGNVWRTKAGNILAPHQGGGDVYVIPAPLKIDLTQSGGPDPATVVRSNNKIEASSTIIGTFEVHGGVVLFDPTP